MKHQPQTAPTTNVGISNNLLKEAIIQNNDDSRQEVNEFLREVAVHVGTPTNGEMPAMEANRRVIEHFNCGQKAMEGFEAAGYFVYAGVKVYEKGKREAFEKRDNLDMEQVNFGAKK